MLPESCLVKASAYDVPHYPDVPVNPRRHVFHQTDPSRDCRCGQRAAGFVCYSPRCSIEGLLGRARAELLSLMEKLTEARKAGKKTYFVTVRVEGDHPIEVHHAARVKFLRRILRWARERGFTPEFRFYPQVGENGGYHLHGFVILDEPLDAETAKKWWSKSRSAATGLPATFGGDQPSCCWREVDHIETDARYVLQDSRKHRRGERPIILLKAAYKIQYAYSTQGFYAQDPVRRWRKEWVQHPGQVRRPNARMAAWTERIAKNRVQSPPVEEVRPDGPRNPQDGPASPEVELVDPCPASAPGGQDEARDDDQEVTQAADVEGETPEQAPYVIRGISTQQSASHAQRGSKIITTGARSRSRSRTRRRPRTAPRSRRGRITRRTALTSGFADPKSTRTARPRRSTIERGPQGSAASGGLPSRPRGGPSSRPSSPTPARGFDLPKGVRPGDRRDRPFHRQGRRPRPRPPRQLCHPLGERQPARGPPGLHPPQGSPPGPPGTPAEAPARPAP